MTTEVRLSSASCQKTTFLFNVEDMASSWTGLGQLPLEPRQNLEEVTDEAISGHLEDRRLFVLVDRDDHLRVLHAGSMLNGPGDPDRDVEIERHHLAGLANLPFVGRSAGIHSGPQGTHRRAELVADRLDIGLEVLGRAERAPTVR